MPTTLIPVTGIDAAVPRPIEHVAPTLAGMRPATTPTVGVDVAVALAEAIVESSFDAHAAGVAVLVADASRRGLSPVLIDIVADATAPLPARHRALGRLLQQWDRVIDEAPAARSVTAA